MTTVHPLRRVALLCGLAVLAAPAIAQDAYPSKPITIVVGYPPGGSTDLTARTVATELGNKLGVPVVIENLGGAYVVGTELKLTLALIIIVGVLIVKPSGLMGRTVYSRV